MQPIPDRIEWMPAGNVEALEDEEDDESSEDELMLGPPSTRHPPGRPKKKHVREDHQSASRRHTFIADASRRGIQDVHA